jgi:hypothetical protein
MALKSWKLVQIEIDHPADAAIPLKEVIVTDSPQFYCSEELHCARFALENREEIHGTRLRYSCASLSI